jgi:hypothetical protein
MESSKLEGGKFVMKSMEIKNHMDVRIDNGLRRP